MLRHPVYLGLREDKPAAAVTLELAVPTADIVKKQTTKSSGSAQHAT